MKELNKEEEEEGGGGCVKSKCPKGVLEERRKEK